MSLNNYLTVLSFPFLSFFVRIKNAIDEVGVAMKTEMEKEMEQ